MELKVVKVRTRMAINMAKIGSKTVFLRAKMEAESKLHGATCFGLEIGTEKRSKMVNLKGQMELKAAILRAKMTAKSKLHGATCFGLENGTEKRPKMTSWRRKLRVQMEPQGDNLRVKMDKVMVAWLRLLILQYHPGFPRKNATFL